MVADSLSTRYRYSSAVIGFAPEDNPTPEQIDQCLDDFRRAMGLEEDRVAWTAIRHDEPGERVGLHVLVARVDLLTGKSFNPAPPGWEKRYDPLRDAWNYENGWSRPDDPERARLMRPGYRAYVEAKNLRKGVESDDPKTLITEYLTQKELLMRTTSPVVRFSLSRQAMKFGCSMRRWTLSVTKDITWLVVIIGFLFAFGSLLQNS